MDRDKLIEELRADEGEKLVAYRDHLGYWTIGVGHLIDPAKGADPAPFGTDLTRGHAITPAQSAQLLSLASSSSRTLLSCEAPSPSRRCPSTSFTTLVLC